MWDDPTKQWRIIIVMVLGLICESSAFADSPTILQQSTGKCSPNINGNNNTVIITCPETLSKYVLKSLQKIESSNQEQEQLKRTIDELEQARRVMGSRIEELEATFKAQNEHSRIKELEATLKAQNEQLLARNAKLESEVVSSLVRAVELQNETTELKDFARRAVIQALEDGELDRAAELIEEAERHGDSIAGVAFSTVSNRTLGNDGYVGGIFLTGSMGDLHGPQWDGRLASLTLAGSGDMLFGNLRSANQSQFLLSCAGRIGPRLRVGAPVGLSFGVYYDFPLIMHSQGDTYYPLVGVATDFGIQYKLFKFTVLYRYDDNQIRYKERPNLSFLGIGLTFLDQGPR